MKLFIIAFLLIPYFSFSQDLFSKVTYDSVKGGEATYEEVVLTPGSKDDLYNKAKIWFAEGFKNANNVIQNDDKADGIIVGKGLLKYEYPMYKKVKNIEKPIGNTMETAFFTIKFFAKDGKYKYIVSDISTKNDMINIAHKIDAVSIMVAKNFERKQDQDKNMTVSYYAMDEAFLSMIDGLKSKMVQKSEADF